MICVQCADTEADRGKGGRGEEAGDFSRSLLTRHEAEKKRGRDSEKERATESVSEGLRVRHMRETDKEKERDVKTW